MNRTMQMIIEAMASMQNKVNSTELHIRILSETQKDVKKSMSDTYNYLKYQPLSREERIRLTERIKERGALLSKVHSLSLENATASIYRMLNKAFNLSSYHELEHKDFLSAYEYVNMIDLSGGVEYAPYKQSADEANRELYKRWSQLDTLCHCLVAENESLYQLANPKEEV